MATAPPIQGPKTILHVRGAWSARDDRTPSAVWLGILWLGMILGFGMDFSRFLHESPPAPRVLYVHAFVFTGWMLLLTAQVLLVLGDRIAWHRKLGWFLAGWACLMVILGPWAAIASQAAALNMPFSDPAISLHQHGQYDRLHGCACLGYLPAQESCRPSPHDDPLHYCHLRSRLLAFLRLSLAPRAALRRGVVLLLLLWQRAAHRPHGRMGWWRGRLMRSFVIAASGIIAGELLASILYFWGPWKALTLSWVQLWARHFA